ncbi:MAG: hypothetical protein FWC45_02140 [Treponema sp.]|nr:hypothetical protein [Treponema sp.]
MTIEQTIEVPASRRIFLDLPPELPIGKAKIELTLTTLNTLQTKSIGKIRLTEEMRQRLLQDEILRSLTGILHTEMSLEEIREDRLAKYLK